MENLRDLSINLTDVRSPQPGPSSAPPGPFPVQSVPVPVRTAPIPVRIMLNLNKGGPAPLRAALPASNRSSLNLTIRSETIMEDVIRHINILQLEELPDDWVDEIWDADFDEVQEIDLEVSNNVILKAMTDITTSSKEWLELEHSELETRERSFSETGNGTGNQTLFNQTAESFSAGFWKTIIEKGVPYKSMMALLCYFMHRGQKDGAGSERRKLCLRASSLYFILLGVPNSSAYVRQLFHSVLFSKALKTFELALKLHLAKLSPKKKKKLGVRNAYQKSSQTQKPRGRHLSRASSTSSGLSQNDFQDSDDDFDDLDGGLSSDAEVKELTKNLNEVLFDFLIFLDNYSLKNTPESMKSSIQQLVDLTHLETEIPNLDFNHQKRRSDLSALAFNAYVGLSKICTKQLHGPIDRNTRQVLKYLLPGLLMNPIRGSSEISAKGLVVIREHSKHFVKHLVALIGEACYEPVEVLVQHMCLRVPDRAESRLKASKAIFDIMLGLPSDNYSRLVRWLLCSAFNDKPARRLFAIEVMGRILTENKDHGLGEEDEDIQEVRVEQPPGGHDYGQGTSQREHGSQVGNPQEQNDSGHRISKNEELHEFMFGVIFCRCRDSAASVRARALQTLADITQVPHIVTNIFRRRAHENRVAARDNILSELISEEQEIVLSQDEGDSVEQNQQQQQRLPRDRISDTSDFVKMLEAPDSDLKSVDPIPSTEDFVDFLRRRALDDSVFVRRNALQVLENILKHATDLFGFSDLIRILSEHCRDPSLMVRKQITVSLTELVKAFPDNDEIIEKWVEGIFPLILDVEQKAAEKVLECIWHCLFDNLVHRNRASRLCHDLPWKILKETERQKMTKYLSRACAAWAKDKFITGAILDRLESHLKDENKDSAWLLLALISGHVPLKDPEFAMNFFNESIHTEAGVSLYTLLQVLRVLFASVSHLAADQQVSLQTDLVELVRRFTIPPELISTAVDICTVVSSIQASKSGQDQNLVLKQYHIHLEGWVVEIIQMIDNELTEKILQPLSAKDAESTRMHSQVFTLGELAQICPNRINNRLFLLMQSIIFQQGKKHRRRKKDKENGVIVPSSQTQTTQPPECAFTPTTRLQALAIISLAKMCLQNEEMAKKIVPAFGRLLATVTEEAAIKNNIVYALSDMCVRYASLVEPLMPQLTACLKEKSLIVRRTTLTTLIHLLQEDYLKMSGSLFFRIVQTLSDPEEEIRQLTTFYIQQRLLKRYPKVMFNYFVEALFHFNEYVSHQSYNKYNVTETERRLFSLKGSDPINRGARMKLYKFMLEHMTDEQRIFSTNRLCTDILNSVNESVRLDDPAAFTLLQDTLSCLSCDEIKLAFLKSRQDENEEEMDGGSGQSGTDITGAVTVAVKKSIITQVVKKNVVDNIVPIVISLKKKLEAAKSPLIDDLMIYLRELMKDYKNEVKEILSAHKTLPSEILFDLKKWEEQEQERMQRQKERDGQEESGPVSPVPSGGDVLRAVLQSAMADLRKKKDTIQKQKKSQIQNLGDGPHTDSEEEQQAVSKNLFHKLIEDVVDQDGGIEDDLESSKRHTEIIADMLSPRLSLERTNEKKLQKSFEKSRHSNQKLGPSEQERTDKTSKHRSLEAEFSASTLPSQEPISENQDLDPLPLVFDDIPDASDENVQSHPSDEPENVQSNQASEQVDGTDLMELSSEIIKASNDAPIEAVGDKIASENQDLVDQDKARPKRRKDEKLKVKKSKAANSLDISQESEPLLVGKVEEVQTESHDPKLDSPPVISEKRKHPIPSSEFSSQEEVVNLDDSKVEEIDDQDLPALTQSQQPDSEPPVVSSVSIVSKDILLERTKPGKRTRKKSSSMVFHATIETAPSIPNGTSELQPIDAPKSAEQKIVTEVSVEVPQEKDRPRSAETETDQEEIVGDKENEKPKSVENALDQEQTDAEEVPRERDNDQAKSVDVLSQAVVEALPLQNPENRPRRSSRSTPEPEKEAEKDERPRRKRKSSSEEQPEIAPKSTRERRDSSGNKRNKRSTNEKEVVPQEVEDLQLFEAPLVRVPPILNDPVYSPDKVQYKRTKLSTVFEVSESTKLVNEDSLQEEAQSSQPLPSTSERIAIPSTKGRSRKSVALSSQQATTYEEPPKKGRSRRTSSQQVTSDRPIPEPSKKGKGKTPIKTQPRSQAEKVADEPCKIDKNRLSSQEDSEILQVVDPSSEDEIPSSQQPVPSRMSKRKMKIPSQSSVVLGKRFRKPTEKVRQSSSPESPDNKKQKVTGKSNKKDKPVAQNQQANSENEPVSEHQVINAAPPKSPTSSNQLPHHGLSPTQVTPTKRKRGLKSILVGVVEDPKCVKTDTPSKSTATSKQFSLDALSLTQVTPTKSKRGTRSDLVDGKNFYPTKELGDKQDPLSLVLEDVGEIGPTQVTPEIEQRARHGETEHLSKAPTSVVEVTSGKRQRKPRNFDDSIWATPTTKNRSLPTTPNRSRSTSIVQEQDPFVQVTVQSADAGSTEATTRVRGRKSTISIEQATTPSKKITRKPEHKVSETQASSAARTPAPGASPQTSPRKDRLNTAKTGVRNPSEIPSEQPDSNLVERSPKKSSSRTARANAPSSPANTASKADNSSQPTATSRKSPRKEVVSTSEQASPVRERSKPRSLISSPKAGPSKGPDVQASPTRRGASKAATVDKPGNQLLVAGSPQKFLTPTRALRGTTYPGPIQDLCTPKAPGLKRKKDLLSNLRAISTPNKDDTMLRENVTFMEQTIDLSLIPVLSPPSTRKKKRKEEEANSTEGSSACSFRFRPMGRAKDPFDKLMPEGSGENVKKRSETKETKSKKNEK